MFRVTTETYDKVHNYLGMTMDFFVLKKSNFIKLGKKNK